ncbi:3-polyprenyl-4-hydroxybenzoate carboxy-lyase UbiX [Vibrio maritimus]|uniref:Flavin prenyltransferase UbiX n=1 Tax=Vibrio maritimus TaxID=990268 RepID=A0A090RY48_9VIBR|nr:3-polyprenyl-4-hydroxybenzoate carboxy-lyase UbiX [Vibrio maritimus]
MRVQKLVVAVTGATGAPLAYKTMQLLKDMGIEIHLVVSKWAKTTIELETDISFDEFRQLASKVYSSQDQAAAISSGSFPIDGMIVVPCSMKTLASIRVGLADNLISRTADVMLKEGRKVILCVRETPLNTIHLENMLFLSKIGVHICPPMPAFYNNPESIEDILTHNAVRMLDLFGLSHENAKRWKV